MKGVIFNLAEEVIVASYGEHTWDALLDAAGLDGSYTSLGSYPDTDLFRLVDAASSSLGTPAADVVRSLGEGALPLLAGRYPAFFDGHASTRSFVMTLNDVIHSEVRKLYPGAQVPEFDFDDSDPGLPGHHLPFTEEALRARRGIHSRRRFPLRRAGDARPATLRPPRRRSLHYPLHVHPEQLLTPMDTPLHPDAATLERRLRRERAARREAEAIAEQATRELYAAVQQLAAAKAVLHETTDFVAIAGVEGRPLYLNPALCELLGFEGADIGQINVVDLLTPQSRARYLDEALPVLREKGLWRGEFAWARPGGGELAVSQVLVAHRGPDGAVERVSSIARNVTAERALQDQLAHQALHDELTGLANRRLFMDRLDLAQARANRPGQTLGLLFIDLDGFKAINDTLGHDAGDEVLITVAGRLRAHMRTTDTLARFGGDEFAVLCGEIAGPADAVEIADRLAAAVAQPFEIQGTPVTIGASIGIAVASATTGSLADLLQCADTAMYQAKNTGKGQWHLFGGTSGGAAQT